jgi:LmbE family N-acetylglucosaminyl deacetylase
MVDVPKTLVCFHAHPDDEAIATGGVMLRAKQRGHRVVLVLATRGEVGEVAEGFLGAGETLGDRRTAETHAAAAVLGVDRVAFLEFRDSGMAGEPTTEEPGTFWTADVEEAAARLAGVLREERADILTIYDDNGGYGHPDHIQVHRVGVRAARLAGTRDVYEATINRDHILRLMETRSDFNVEESPVEEIDESFGVSEDRITTVVDVRDLTGAKRRAMAAHASQIDEQSFFLSMSEEAFVESFGWEWYIRHGVVRAPDQPIEVLDSLVDGRPVRDRPFGIDDGVTGAGLRRDAG